MDDNQIQDLINEFNGCKEIYHQLYSDSGESLEHRIRNFLWEIFRVGHINEHLWISIRDGLSND